MATPLLTRNFLAGGIIPKCTIVALAAGRSMVVCDADASPIGVSPNELDIAAGQRADVILVGTANVRYGDTVPAGAVVTSDATGRAVPAQLGDRVIGVALDAGALDDIGEICVLPGVMPSAAPVTTLAGLTDNTGGEETADDILADGLTAEAPAAQTSEAPAEITNYAAVVDMSAQVTKAEGEAMSAALATLENEVTALRSTVAAIVADITALHASLTAAVTDLGVGNQNASDLGQKVNEVLAKLIAAGIIAAE